MVRYIYTPESSNEQDSSSQETHTVDGEVQIEWPGISTHLSPAMRRAATKRPTQWMVKYR